MHILGKVFLVLLIPAAATGTVLLARQLEIRNSYTKPLADLQVDVNKNAEDLAKLEDEILQKELQLQRVMQKFQASWDGVSASPKVDASGQLFLETQIGTNRGLGQEVGNDAGNVKVRKHQVIHVFKRKAAGSNETEYVGRFVLTSDTTKILPDKLDILPDWTVEEGDWKMFGVADGPTYQQQIAPLYAQVDMTRKALRNARVDLLRAKDAAARTQAVTKIGNLETQLKQNIDAAKQAGWQRLLGRLGPVWRIHSTLPSPISVEFTDKYLTLEKEKIDLETMAVHKIHSDRDLQETQAEVVALEKRIAGDNRDGGGGLILELRQAETERNKVLVEVDRFRKLIYQVDQQRDALVKANKKIVDDLKNAENGSPQPKTAPKQ